MFFYRNSPQEVFPLVFESAYELLHPIDAFNIVVHYVNGHAVNCLFRIYFIYVRQPRYYSFVEQPTYTACRVKMADEIFIRDGKVFLYGNWKDYIPASMEAVYN